jgi:hypothetical protein
MPKHCIVYTNGTIDDFPRVMGIFNTQDEAFEEAAFIACMGCASWEDTCIYNPEDEMLYNKELQNFYLGKERLWVVNEEQLGGNLT